MTIDQLKAIAKIAAINMDLDPALVMSVIEHESSWNPWAVRYEPAFYTRYIEKMVGLSSTEKTMRATSFGLMQVMGQVAREKGYDEKFLTSLCDPLNGVMMGCVKLRECWNKAHGDVRETLLCFNGGGDASYPDAVLANMDKYR